VPERRASHKVEARALESRFITKPRGLSARYMNMNRKEFLLGIGGGAAIVFSPWLSRLLAGASGSPGAAAAPGLVTVRLMGKDGKLTAPTEVPKVVKTDAEWRKQLTADQYKIARGKGTEPAFCGVFYDNHKDGIYHCICCNLPLFKSDTKFDSGTGWPSFFQPIAKENVTSHTDNSFGMDRTEIECTLCDGHLGHVFNDGPAPTGLRYCLNSAALTFVGVGHEVEEKVAQVATAAFAAGCFWGSQETFEHIPGVVNTTVGFMGGNLAHPTYEDVCTDKTGHAETVQVQYDPTKVTYQQLLGIFWANHDPTTPDQQGPDVGTQYRSVIFYYTPEQKTEAEASEKAAQAHFSRPIVTQLVAATTFWKAEDYHQHYDDKNGTVCKPVLSAFAK
jgi:peptide methionine sulfoxide reductase msrA/msrB